MQFVANVCTWVLMCNMSVSISAARSKLLENSISFEVLLVLTQFVRSEHVLSGFMLFADISFCPHWRNMCFTRSGTSVQLAYVLVARLRELHVGLASAQCDARGLRSINRGRHASRHTFQHECLSLTPTVYDNYYLSKRFLF